jgi:hypothetical protein
MLKFVQKSYKTKGITLAGVVKLVDTLDLGSSGASCGGSSPFARTNQQDCNL